MLPQLWSRTFHFISITTKLDGTVNPLKAADAGMLDGERAMLEAHTAIVRAGAGIVLTYFAKELARYFRGR